MLKLTIFFPSSNLAFIRVLALLIITSTVQKSLDTGCEVYMIEADFSAAFDHVNHETLILKLRQMGIHETFLNIIIEFFMGRKQVGGG